MEGFFLSLKWMFCHQNWTSYTPKIAIFCFYDKKNNKIRYYIKDLLSFPKDMTPVIKSYNFSIDNHNYSCLAKVSFTKFVNIEFIYYLCNIYK